MIYICNFVVIVFCSYFLLCSTPLSILLEWSFTAHLPLLVTVAFVFGRAEAVVFLNRVRVASSPRLHCSGCSCLLEILANVADSALLLYFISCSESVHMPSVIWHCWLGVRKSIWSVKNWSGGVLVWLSVWCKVQIVCIWSSWCHCIPKPHHLLPHLSPVWFYLSGTGLRRLSWKRGR